MLTEPEDAEEGERNELIKSRNRIMAQRDGSEQPGNRYERRQRRY